MVTRADGPGQQTGENHANELREKEKTVIRSRTDGVVPRPTHLNERDADADAGEHAGLVLDLLAELRHAADRVDALLDVLHRRVDEDVRAAALRVVAAAAVRHVPTALAERRVRPVRVVHHAAALDLRVAIHGSITRHWLQGDTLK